MVSTAYGINFIRENKTLKNSLYIIYIRYNIFIRTLSQKQFSGNGSHLNHTSEKNLVYLQ